MIEAAAGQVAVRDGGVAAQQPLGPRRPQHHVEDLAGDLAALLVGKVLQLVGEDQLERGAVILAAILTWLRT